MIIILSALSSFAKEVVILGADEWYPYTGKSNSDRPGYMVEIAKDIFAKHNIDVEYVVKPWSQILYDVGQGTMHGVIGISYDDNDFLVYPTAPQAYGMINAYILPEYSWRYDNIDSLQNKKIGLIENYHYPDDISKYIGEHKTQSPELFVISRGIDALQQQIDNLTNKKIDVILENEYVMNYMMKFNHIILLNAGQINNKFDQLYIAFSPKLKKSYIYAKILSEGMVEMRNSGRLAKLYSKYNINN